MSSLFTAEIIKKTISCLKFNDKSLIPVIAQQHDSGEILMMAWMNEEAVKETLSTGRICYYSRSRQKLWRKGETSGQIQKLINFRFDCDADTILLQIDQTGAACHTGRRNCFYNQVTKEGIATIAQVIKDPAMLYHK